MQEGWVAPNATKKKVGVEQIPTRGGKNLDGQATKSVFEGFSTEFLTQNVSGEPSECSFATKNICLHKKFDQKNWHCILLNGHEDIMADLLFT